MNDKPSNKALLAAVAFLVCAVILIAVAQIRHRSAEDSRESTSFDESTEGDTFTTDELASLYAPSAGKSEHITETTTIADTTTETETTTERQTERETDPPEPAAEDDYLYQSGDLPGDYIGTFTLTAYEWTGERMANGEWPYYGACASNYFALGTVLYIDGYGTFTVKDRGGPSMGNNIIDIYLGDEAACWEFGRRTADVYYG